MNNSTGENAYTILETLHKSKHFYVYKAKNYFRGNFVTIKTNDQRWRTDSTLNRLLRNEAEAGLNLKHPNISATTGLFEDEGTVYMVCDFIQGDSLSTLLSVPKVDISYDLAFKWTLQLLDALEYAHAQGSIHINLNPQNIIVTPEYDLKLFGFGKSPGAWKTADSDKNDYHPILFTPPEVFLEENPCEGSDLYSLGVLSYLLFCGKLPWSLDRKDTPSHQKQQTLQRPVTNPELTGRRVPHWLFCILNKSLMLEPALRFPSAAQMRSALNQKLEIPFESCLKQFVPEIIPSLEPVAVIPEPVESEVPTLEVPIVFPEENVPEPVEIRAPKEVESKQTFQPPQEIKNPKAEESSFTFSMPFPKLRKHLSSKKSQRLPEEVTRMDHIFRIFGIISLVILGYIVIKYVLISDKPKFSKPSSEEVLSTGDADLDIKNQPLPMIFVSGGPAIMGGSSEDAENDEYPSREIKIASFSIGAHEVTREQWAMVTPGYAVADDEKNLPVTNVSFYDVLDYCNAKSIADGLKPCYESIEGTVICDFTANGYRLPTEAEWEYAAKGALSSNFTLYSGSDYANEVGWYIGNSDDALQPVKQKKANKLGIYDMSGNVYEWVWDWYGSYSDQEETLYSGPQTGTDKVLRGGSWQQTAREMRSTNRYYAKPYRQSDEIGFRVATSKK